MQPRSDDSSLLGDPDRLRSIERLELDRGTRVETLDRYTRLASRLLDAPVALVSIVTPDEQLFPAQLGLDEPWASRGCTPLSHSFCRFVVGGDPLVVPNSAQHELVRDNPARTELGISAYLGAPIPNSQGKILGALCVIDHRPRAWTEDDLATLSDLAEGVAAELSLRERTLELHREHESERTARHVEHALFEAASASSGSSTVQGAARALVRHIRTVMDSDLAVLTILDGDTAHQLTSPRTTDRTAVEPRPFEPNDPLIAAALDHRRITLTASSGQDGWGELRRELVPPTIEQLRVVPLPAGEGLEKGSIAVGWQTGRSPLDREDAFDALCTLAAQTLRRAHRYEAELEHAQTLERIILPTLLPSPPGLELAGDYVAPANRQRVGGDLYDAIRRDDGAVALLIADATGHDIDAARAIARVRHAVGALTIDDRSPAEILTAVNRYLLRSTISNLVTCAYVLLDPDLRQATIANAGHPRPFLIDGRTATPIGPTGDPLLGVSAHDYSELTVDLPTTAGVVLYTDGLVERRGEHLGIGEERLRAQLETFEGQTAAEFVQNVLAPLEEASFEDDVALLCARLTGARLASPATSFERAWSAGQLHLREARDTARLWLTTRGASAMASEVELIVTELLTNARDASLPSEPVLLRLVFEGTDVTVEVENVGSGFRSSMEMPESTAHRGRGLAMVRALSSLVSIEKLGRVVRVRARISESFDPPGHP